MNESFIKKQSMLVGAGKWALHPPHCAPPQRFDSTGVDGDWVIGDFDLRSLRQGVILLTGNDKGATLDRIMDLKRLNNSFERLFRLQSLNWLQFLFELVISV
jgi:hypothetical protein